MLGGNGISDEYHIIRHVMNLEAVNTYEGIVFLQDMLCVLCIVKMNSRLSVPVSSHLRYP